MTERVAERVAGPGLGVMAGRFSRLALWCYAIVGVSGVANALTRLPSPGLLLSTWYGRLVVGKAVAFTVLGWCGWWHRERTIPRLTAPAAPTAPTREGDSSEVGKRGTGPFIRLASIEVAVMAAAMGLAAALARTPTPTAPATSPATSTATSTARSMAANPVRDLLGYDLPPAMTAARLAALWRLDLFFAVVVVAAGGLYAAGVWRLRRQRGSWPAWRSAAWALGVISIVVVTMSGVETYAPVLFRVHLTQQMILTLVTPILLVLGAPVTLALRALKPAAADGDRGPREWLMVVLASRAARTITHPAAAAIIFFGVPAVVYSTPVFETANRAPAGHTLLLTCFVLSGCLYFWGLTGTGPGARRLSYPGRLLAVFLLVPSSAVLGITLMAARWPIAADWYLSLDRHWGPTPLPDQHAAGAIAWAFGDIVALIVLTTLVVQRHIDDRQTTRDQVEPAPRTPDADTNEIQHADPTKATAHQGP